MPAVRVRVPRARTVRSVRDAATNATTALPIAAVGGAVPLEIVRHLGVPSAAVLPRSRDYSRLLSLVYYLPPGSSSGCNRKGYTMTALMQSASGAVGLPSIGIIEPRGLS